MVTMKDIPLQGQLGVLYRRQVWYHIQVGEPKQGHWDLSAQGGLWILPEEWDSVASPATLDSPTWGPCIVASRVMESHKPIVP